MRTHLCLHICLLLSLAACTENARARNFGGTEEVRLECGEELVNATWKEDSLWVLTKTAGEDHRPTTHRFKEKSSYGVVEGSIIFIECAGEGE